MAIDPAKVREEALSLPANARARLAADLLGSLDDDEDIVDPREHDAAWSSEIEGRLRAVDAGEIATVPWSEARRRIVREE